jgi:hypothetical protein
MRAHHLLAVSQGGRPRRPPLWPPPVALSTAEHVIIKRSRRAKWLVFLRQPRQTLFADPWPQALWTLSKAPPPGQPPGPPAHLALAPLLPAYTPVADDEGMEAPRRERRWPVGLDGRDCAPPPCSPGPLGALRPRLIAQPLERRLRERTVESAAASGACGPRQGRAARARSPRWGAGRVAAPSPWLGHALRQALGVRARQQGRGLRARAAAARAALRAGASWQAAVALAGDAPGARPPALPRLLASLTAVAPWLAPPPVEAETTARAVARRAVAQPVWPPDRPTAPEGPPPLRQGVAAERRLRVDEAARRHGRQSRRRRLDGYQRQGGRARDARRMGAVGGTPAQAPAARGTDASAAHGAAPPGPLRAWHRDRASLARPLGQPRSETWTIVCQAWPGHPGPYCSTHAVHLAGERHTLQGPGGAGLPCVPGEVVQVPAAPWARGAWRERWPTRASGRRGPRQPDAAWWHELRARQQTPQGRAQRRERVAVDQALAHVGRWQGRRARSRGVRNKVFDLRRCAVVHN